MILIILPRTTTTKGGSYRSPLTPPYPGGPPGPPSSNYKRDDNVNKITIVE
jgi:hypothetical protein